MEAWGLPFINTVILVTSSVTVTFAVLPLVVVTGVRLARVEDVARRTWHKRTAAAFVLAVLVTFVLGLLMTVLATPA